MYVFWKYFLFHLIDLWFIIAALPKEDPTIEGILSSYSVGDYVTGNCTSAPSYPGSKLAWHINGEPVCPPFFLLIFRGHRYVWPRERIWQSNVSFWKWSIIFYLYLAAPNVNILDGAASRLRTGDSGKDDTGVFYVVLKRVDRDIIFEKLFEISEDKVS